MAAEGAVVVEAEESASAVAEGGVAESGLEEAGVEEVCESAVVAAGSTSVEGDHAAPRSPFRASAGERAVLSGLRRSALPGFRIPSSRRRGSAPIPEQS